MTDKKTKHLEALAEWIEARLVATTNLDKTACGLIANDLVANLPQPFNAAPDLLGELKSMVAWVSECDPEGYARQLRNARAAIAKAENQ